MEENVQVFVPKQEQIRKKYEFVDLSGHFTQSYRVKKYCSNVQYVIFMIDSSDLQNINHSAKMLFHLLSMKQFDAMKPRPKLLIIGNKKDRPNASSMYTIKSTLIKELNKLSTSHSSLSSVDETADGEDEAVDIRNGVEGALKWDDIGYDVSFGTTSVLEQNIDCVLDFLP